MPTDLHSSPQPGRWFDYDRPADPSSAHSPPLCSTAHAWASTPPPLTTEERQAWHARARELLARENAVLVAHYYVDAALQDLARETGGCVGDSLEMARFGRDHEASTIVVAGVRFMGETAFILSPEKRILMPDLDATCSLDLGCAADEFAAFRSQHPGRTTVVYANTSAAVKAQADWVVTSSVGLDIVASLHARGEKILWAPDRHLGSYIQRQTGADMVLWQGSCLVHNEFKGFELDALRTDYPHAKVLVHPESPDSVVTQADVVGSTSRLIQAAMELDATHFIVATDLGILHEMRLRAPGKTFLPAPTSGNSATCKSCAFCPWMAMNGLAGLVQALEHGTGRITLDPGLAHAARRSIARMLDFAANRNMRVQASGDMEKDTELYSHVGAA